MTYTKLNGLIVVGLLIVFFSVDPATAVAQRPSLATIINRLDTLESDVSTLQGEVTTLEGEVTTLENENLTLQSANAGLQAKLANVTLNPGPLNGLPGPNLLIDGANLQVLNDGSGGGTTLVEEDVSANLGGFINLNVNNRIGIDQISPDADFHIRQSQNAIAGGTGGVLFEDAGDPNDTWRIYHSGIYFSFNNKGDRVAFINDSSGAWIQDSDRSLKKNITPLSSTLDKVMRLNAVNYQYKRQIDERYTTGFIAQEVQPLFPELVFTGEDGQLGMSYANTGVIAIKAVQEQQEIIEAQKKENEALRAKNEAFEARLAAIEKMLEK